jgi:hypothetical protein
MTVIYGTPITKENEYDKLVAPFLEERPNLVKLWESNKANDQHSKMLYEAGVRYMNSH